MNATIEGSRVVILPAAKKYSVGPVTIPGIRAEDQLDGTVRLVSGPANNPECWGICSSRAVADRACGFFGGSAGDR